MQYKDPLEPPKVASAETSGNRQKPAETGRNRQKPAETGRNRQKPAETSRNRQKTDKLFYPDLVKHFFTVLQNKNLFAVVSCSRACSLSNTFCGRN
jgi:hypothetical protein